MLELKLTHQGLTVNLRGWGTSCFLPADFSGRQLLKFVNYFQLSVFSSTLLIESEKVRQPFLWLQS